METVKYGFGYQAPHSLFAECISLTTFAALRHIVSDI